MDIVVLNGIMLPLFATWFIPVAVRDSKTGEFKGLWTIDFVATIAALVVFECYVTIDKLGPGLWPFSKIVICIVMTIGLGFLFVYLTQKQLFGNKFEMKVK